MINLVGNALKFTDSGEVEISVSQDLQRGDQTILHFRVRDSGRGIPKEHHQRIFEAFVQADGSMKRAHGGNSSRLVTMMGGEIWLDSAPGAQYPS